MKTLFFSIALTLMTFTLHAQRVEIQEPALMYQDADVESKRLYAFNVLDDLIITGKGDKATINGKTDFWYTAKKEIYNTETWELIRTIEGYIFGHFTSFKLEGQKTLNLTFEGCEMGDCFHLIFGDYDFGSAANVHTFPDEFCLYEEDVVGDPKFVGKEMKVTMNELYYWDYEYCNPDRQPTQMKTHTIVHLELAD